MIGKTKDGQDTEFPLKELVRCPVCQRKITGYFSKGRNDRYPYYGCQKAGCKNRFCVSRKVFDEQFNEFLDSIKITDTMMDIFKLGIESVWNNRENFESIRKQELQDRILKLDDDMKRLSRKVVTIRIPDLVTQLENEWEECKLEKEALQKQLAEDRDISQNTLEELIMNAEKIFKQPKEVFKLGNKELQKMTISLLFGDQLFYSKKKKLRTAQKSLLNLMFTTIKDHETSFGYEGRNKSGFESQFSRLYSLFQCTPTVGYNFI